MRAAKKRPKIPAKVAREHLERIMTVFQKAQEPTPAPVLYMSSMGNPRATQDSNTIIDSDPEETIHRACCALKFIQRAMLEGSFDGGPTCDEQYGGYILMEAAIDVIQKQSVETAKWMRLVPLSAVPALEQLYRERDREEREGDAEARKSREGAS